MSDLLTHEEAAARLRVCSRTLRNLRQQGLIRYVAVSPRKIFYRPEDCDAYLDSCLRVDFPQDSTRRRAGRSTVRRATGNIVPFSVRQGLR